MADFSGGVSVELTFGTGNLLFANHPSFTGGVSVDLSLTSTLILGEVLTGKAVLPALKSEGQHTAELLYTGAFSLPGLTSDGYFGLSGVVTLPAISSDGTLFDNGNLNAIIKLPAVTAAGVLDVETLYTGTVKLPALTVTGVGLVGASLSGVLTIPAVMSAGQIPTELTVTGAPALPAVTSKGVILVDGLMASDATTLPAILSAGDVENSLLVATYTGWSVTEDGLHTNYDAFEFIGFAEIGGSYYGIAADGVYLLEGESDDGLPINAEFMSGLRGRNDSLSMPTAVYVGGEFETGLLEVLIRQGDGVEYDYDVTHISDDDGRRTGRAEPGKGLRGRYWGIGVRNVNGADFEIDTIGVSAPRSKRNV